MRDDYLVPATERRLSREIRTAAWFVGLLWGTTGLLAIGYVLAKLGGL